MDHIPGGEVNNVKLQEENVEEYLFELGVDKDPLIESRKQY